MPPPLVATPSSSNHITVAINIFLSSHLQHLTHITFTINIVIQQFHHSFLPPTTSPSSSSIINISVTFNIDIYHNFLPPPTSLPPSSFTHITVTTNIVISPHLQNYSATFFFLHLHHFSPSSSTHITATIHMVISPHLHHLHHSLLSPPTSPPPLTL